MKNIVLLSDGTGNSAAKRHKTNVWRLYHALNLGHPNEQIAFYDDGVGSQEFLPFKLLGSAFGCGLRRNVLELYMTLCRTYTEGDRIYLFGFSRGAFTVRMLAGLIECCGLAQSDDDGKLRKIACRHFGSYRSRYKRGYVHRILRSLTRPVCRLFTRTPATVEQSKGESEERRDGIPITFIGAWDTVDAYGFPVYELTSLWDLLIWPLRFVDQKLSKNVGRACHALSIDEERASFRPMLWDEKGSQKDKDERESDKVKGKKDGSDGDEDPRIEQVWFAGVHADVGGGYPRSELALVTLDWMISKVEATKRHPDRLCFVSTIRDEYKHRANCHGVQHDSRSGLRAYYRYKPRDIGQLCKEQGIASPAIHRSVLERIQKKIVAYAPTALPYMNRARTYIHLRRWLYAAFVLATLTFAFLPLFLPGSARDGCVGWICLAGLPFRLAACILPDCFLPWIEGWIDVVQNPCGLLAITSVPQSQAQASASCGRARSGGEWVVKRSSRGRRSKMLSCSTCSIWLRLQRSRRTNLR